MAELGKIEKPTVESYANDRKIIMVPLLFMPPNQNDTLKEHVNKYWKEAKEQLATLQSQFGKAQYIFHEMLVSDKNVKEMTEAYGCNSFPIIEESLANGAKLSIIEDKELFEEFMDWNRILSTCSITNKNVYEKVVKEYKETNEKRDADMAKKILDTVKDKEIGILMLQEGRHIQFPSDVQVIYVAPPALDELEKYVRDEYMKEMQKRQEEATKEKETKAD